MTRRRVRFVAEISVLSCESGDYRSISSQTKINQSGVEVMRMPREYLTVDAGACLRLDVAPRVESVGDNDVSVGVRQVYGAAEGVVVIILEA